MKITRSILMAMGLLCALHARATEYTWVPTGAGSHDWNVAGNWGGDGFPNGAGDVANLNTDIAGAQTARLRQDITVGHINLGDSEASIFATTIGNLAGEGYTLTFDSGEAGVPTGIRLSTPGTATHSLAAPAVLASDLVIDLTGVDANNRQRISFGTNLMIGARSLIFTNGVYGQNQVTIGTGSDWTGTGMVVNNSSSTIGVDGKKQFSGRVIANGLAGGSNVSTFTLTTGGFTNASEMVVNGYVTNSIDRAGGGIQEGNGSTQSTNPGQRFTNHRLTLNGGYVVKYGQGATAGSANDWQLGLEWDRDDIAVLDFNSGYNYLSIGGAASTQGGVFHVETLERGRGASVYMPGANATNKNLIVGNAADFLIGAETDTGTMRKIVTWMGIYESGNSKNPAGFSTYDLSTGFRALNTSTEYATTLTAGADHNVSINSVSLAADATINSLRYTGGSTSVGQGRTLTITSGGLFFNGSGTLGVSGAVSAGTVNLGATEGVISVHASNSATIGAVIAGTDGFSKVQSGTLTLTGANTVGGPVHVGGGTLRVGDGTYSSNVGSGDVNVHAGATLRISCDAAIINDATVTLYNLGPDFYFGKIEIDAGRDETVKLLYLGEQGMSAGTYGSTASAATNKDDRYFAGTGILTVTSSAVAFDPTTLIIVR
jgi:autotransporter-associated beta strand protein